MKIANLSLLALMFCCKNMTAQRLDTIATDTLREVVVTAQRAPASLHDTPAALERFTAKMLLDQQSRTTPEALLTLPGVFVQKTNHGGGSPFLRGLTGNQTLLLVDGIRLSNATFRYGPNQYLNTIDPFSIARMEVWKGGGSVAYGSDALGGTINILTQTPEFQYERVNLSESLQLSERSFHGKALAQARTHGLEKTAHFEAGFSGEKMALLAGGTLRNFGDLVGGDSTGRQSPSGYDEGAFDTKGKFRLGKAASLTLAHQFFRQADVPVFHKIQLENFARNHTVLQERQLSYARLEWLPVARFSKTGQTTQARFWKTGLRKITATASLQRTDEHREMLKNGSSTLRLEQDEVTSWGASAQAEMKLIEGWQATGGAEFYHDLVGSERLDTDLGTGIATEKRGLYPNGSTHASAAIFWLNHWETGKWDFFGGLRFNHFSIKVEDETIGEAHLRPAALVWNVAVLRHLGKKDNLFGSVNKGFRAPNVDDLGSLGIVDFRYELPTADLQPEKAYNLELGWRHRSERLQAEAFVFRNELRSLIARVRVGTDSIAGYPVFQKENIEEGYVQGFEMTANWLIIKNISFQSALTWQRGQNVTNDEPLRRIPPVFGRLAVGNGGDSPLGAGGKSQLSWTIEWLAAAKQDRLAAGDKSDNRIPAGGTPGWQVVNVYGSFEWKCMTVRMGFWNVFNEDYRYHGSGVNGVGRSGSLALEASF